MRQEKREKEQKGKYRYYDVIHKEYIEVPDELRPVLAKLDRHTRYLDSAQYCHNHVYVISDLDYCEEKHFSYSDNGFEAVLDRMCATKYWEEIASILSCEEMTLLLEIYYLGYGFAQVSLLDSASYAAVASRKRRILNKLRKYFQERIGNDAHSVYDHYFG